MNHIHNQSIEILVKDKPNPSLYNKWVRKDGGEDHHWEEFMARPWPLFANVSATMFPYLRTWVKEHLICKGGQKNQKLNRIEPNCYWIELLCKSYELIHT